VAIASPALPALAQQSDEATAKAQVEAATKIADSDLRHFLGLCTPMEPPPRVAGPDAPNPLAALMANSAVEPMKIFDNLYFVGTKWVSAWAIQTSEGIILIDALDNDEEAERYITGGLRRLGLDPARIKYVVITHAHGDHYGGIGHLLEKYHPRVVMSDLDWRELEKPELQFDNPLWGHPPKRDLAIADRHQLKLGDTTVDLYLTPGHTPGTLSLVFSAKDGAQTHRVLLWGGTAFNFGRIAPQLRDYIGSTQRMLDVVKTEGVNVSLSNHARYDQSVELMARLAKRQSGEPHPFIVGTETVIRTLQVMGTCARAVLLTFAPEN
jgi:metallo-beta-lactamase class B